MNRDDVRNTLMSRRAALLRLAAVHRANEDELLAMREPDWEDAAADLRDARILDRLAAGERRELGEIEAALRRMARGTWGTCEDCGRRIPTSRLRARPEATRCLRCAETTIR